MYGDAGWGRDVQRGKYVDGRFGRELVVASARAIRDRWRPQPAPTWVTALPSSAQRGLVDAFARSLAAELGLPYVECLSVLDGAAPQKEMQNSSQQLRNAHAKLGIDAMTRCRRAGPPRRRHRRLRLDADGRGSLLRSHGSGPVHPFALAMASGRDD